MNPLQSSLLGGPDSDGLEAGVRLGSSNAAGLPGSPCESGRLIGYDLKRGGVESPAAFACNRASRLSREPGPLKREGAPAVAATLTCPECGTYLLPDDLGQCPVCRRAVRAFEGPNSPKVPRAAAEAVDDADLIIDDPGPEDSPWIEDRFESDVEPIFQDACALLRQPEAAKRRAGAWLGLSMVAFVAFSRTQSTLREVLLITGVILLHELGHLAGMVVFGYRDVKMFFLPFFGGAAMGKKEGAPQWQVAIVLLLGPLPGLVAGCGLLAWSASHPGPLLRSLGWCLVLVNGFNLLPLGFLDGGKFLNLVIFSRHRLLEALFLVATSLTLAALGLAGRMYLLAGLGLLGLLAAPMRYRIAGAGAEVRRRWTSMPARVGLASEPMLRDVFRATRSPMIDSAKDAAKLYAGQMRQVYEKAHTRPVGVLAAFGLLVVYAGGVALTVLGLALMIAGPRIMRGLL